MRKEDTVKLVSAEGFEFVIHREAAALSDTLRRMLSSGSSIISPPSGVTETAPGELKLPDISTPVLEKVCEYFYWSLQFANGIDTEFHFDPEITSELMRAASYLHT